MFTRRVILLFVLFTLAFAVLAIRLAVFQLAQADQWSQQATRFVQRHYLIETRRGTIFDAKRYALKQGMVNPVSSSILRKWEAPHGGIPRAIVQTQQNAKACLREYRMRGFEVDVMERNVPDGGSETIRS